MENRTGRLYERLLSDGREAEAVAVFEIYRRALELDPGNENAASKLQELRESGIPPARWTQPQ